jgi:hypothetical protein
MMTKVAFLVGMAKNASSLFSPCAHGGYGAIRGATFPHENCHENFTKNLSWKKDEIEKNSHQFVNNKSDRFSFFIVHFPMEHYSYCLSYLFALCLSIFGVSFKR